MFPFEKSIDNIKSITGAPRKGAFVSCPSFLGNVTALRVAATPRQTCPAVICLPQVPSAGETRIRCVFPVLQIVSPAPADKGPVTSAGCVKV